MNSIGIIPLKKLINDKGYLMEVMKNNDEHFTAFGDAYITATHAGVVKAWYRHTHQTDRIALITGHVKLVCYNNLLQLPAHELLELELTVHTPQLIIIPPMVWHGFKNVGTQTAIMIHLNDKPYNENDVDEERLDILNTVIPFNFYDI